MIAEKIRKGTRYHIENELKAYHDTRKEIIKLRNEILYNKSSYDENVGGGRSSTPGDPTGRTATALATNRRLTHLEGTVNAIEEVYNRLPAEKQRFIVLSYWTRPQMLSMDGIANHLHISRRTAYNWRDEVIYAVTNQLGWR